LAPAPATPSLTPGIRPTQRHAVAALSSESGCVRLPDGRLTQPDNDQVPISRTALPVSRRPWMVSTASVNCSHRPRHPISTLSERSASMPTRVNRSSEASPSLRNEEMVFGGADRRIRGGTPRVPPRPSRCSANYPLERAAARQPQAAGHRRFPGPRRLVGRARRAPPPPRLGRPLLVAKSAHRVRWGSVAAARHAASSFRVQSSLSPSVLSAKPAITPCRPPLNSASPGRFASRLARARVLGKASGGSLA
jgi:hypothetical protein